MDALGLGWGEVANYFQYTKIYKTFKANLLHIFKMVKQSHYRP